VIYLDTSALVKRFVQEPGSRAVDRLLATGKPVGTSIVAYAELFAALARKRRDRALPLARYQMVAGEVEREWSTYVRVTVLPTILARSRRLVETHPLRGFDALHLASAAYLAEALEVDVTFAAADRRLLDAAAAEGLVAADVGAD
jgi:predicted nucleic acid-binding protein